MQLRWCTSSCRIYTSQVSLHVWSSETNLDKVAKIVQKYARLKSIYLNYVKHDLIYINLSQIIPVYCIESRLSAAYLPY